ncbi:glycoside hydrolase family 3 C-terminal domain-containing protein [Saccharicrinis fermentans]|uniref:Periplasmic beta-glucosidase n=1 Tax=Saccharicrinis fermentans DSM 9555 = JCM 21142 TaxID=869213 RepID=W7Y6C2_9BACT|nr:glycoside hydrolase family 3 C-terminal domain-containing protein [Saccharicrinis fermentans]GAF03168.1 periplasmic beta-glucosidase precursor [Saccharicrinis fermentans DSM 9555 = JCM 21142]
MVHIFKQYLLLILLIAPWLLSCNHKKYCDTSLSFETRVDDVLAQMTLEEKVSQLVYNSPAIERLGIPEYNWWNECLHGVGRAGISTVFPQAIGMAAMWDDSAMFDIATIVSDEARAKHHAFAKKGKRGIYQGLTYWTPNINIFRDPRWGRGMETYGEDPYLTGKLGVAYIKGLQGDDDKYLKLIATAKHFAVHSGPEVSRHRFDVVPSKYDFLETYSPQFKMAIHEAGVYSVMCAYNSYKGKPCCGNLELSNLLRNEWGFEGYIVSDCWAVTDFYAQNGHEIVNTKAEAAAIALKAGTDLNCGDSYPALVEAVKEGYLTEDEIDVSLRRLMLARMKLGMFDKDVPFENIPLDVVDSEQHQQAALEAARKSMVLLKNEDDCLPFSKQVKRIAVIGPNANNTDVLLGNYHGYPSKIVTPFLGIKNKVSTADVGYALGCHLADSLPVLTAIPPEVLFTDKTKSSHGLIGEYFNNLTFAGKPQTYKVNHNIDFKWWNNSPDKTINPDTFSVRWSGVLVPELTGKYAIGTESFPKVKLWVNGELLVDYKSEHHPAKEYEYLDLEAGKPYNLKIEYIQEKTEYARASLLWEAPSNDLKKEALELAQQADLVVLCMGLSPRLEGEEMKVKVDGFSHGDRDDIQLPAVQTDLIKAIYNLGKPTVLVLLNGSALAFNWEAENIPAILEAWYPGQAGGTAIADIIFGDYNPSGRLPLTFYQSVGQLPDFDDYDMAGRTYRYFDGEPLYEFGYGLSYTNFEYSKLKVPTKICAGDEFTVNVTVTNTGKMDGEEVVQLYISHPYSSLPKAIRSLKGFKRVALKAGESIELAFKLTPQDIALLNTDYEYVIQEGAVEVSVGGSQPNEQRVKDKKVLGATVKIEVNDAAYYTVLQE